MIPISLGDVARTFQLRQQSFALNSRLGQAAQELTTGRSADTGKRLCGNFVQLAAIERSLTILKAHDRAAAQAGVTAAAMQAGLAHLSDSDGAMSGALLLASDLAEPSGVQSAGVTARGRLEQAVQALNGSTGGRTLFAGAATDGAALNSAETIMAALSAAIAGETTARGIADAVTAWFETPGGGFETVAYRGTDAPAGPLRLAEGQTVTLDIRADDPALRGVLKGMALGALLADEAVLSGDAAGRATLARIAGQAALEAETPLTGLRAKLGSAEAGIESIKTENTARRSVLEMARNDLVGVDPYDAATELEAVQGRIETLYTITARMSRLSLADFLT